MPTLHVSSLSKLNETVAAVGASHVVTLINAATAVETPPGIAAERHLMLAMSDITAEMAGHVIPASEHVERLLGFVPRYSSLEAVQEAVRWLIANGQVRGQQD